MGNTFFAGIGAISYRRRLQHAAESARFPPLPHTARAVAHEVVETEFPILGFCGRAKKKLPKAALKFKPDDR
jgi:hypothetical protein